MALLLIRPISFSVRLSEYEFYRKITGQIDSDANPLRPATLEHKEEPDDDLSYMARCGAS